MEEALARLLARGTGAERHEVETQLRAATRWPCRWSAAVNVVEPVDLAQ